MQQISDLLIKKIKKLGFKKYFLHEPDIESGDILNLKKCIDTKNISASGDYHTKFEKLLSKMTKSKFVVSTNSGTSALHISCILSGIGPGDEVILPAFTFVAPANSILYCGAIPHFVEIEKNFLGIDFDKLKNYLIKNTIKKGSSIYNKKTMRKIKAIIPVHPFGYPVDCEKMIKLAKDFNLTIIEDAADALGSYYKNKHVGTFGKFGVLSFNGNKIITCGSGGAILTQSKKLALKARSLINTSKVNHKFRFIHDDIGFNYRMSNINAAIGYSQLLRIKNIIGKKKKLFKYYQNNFLGNKYFDIIKEKKNLRFNYWLQTIILKKKYRNQTEKVINKIIKANIFVRQGWDLMTDLKFLKKFPKMKIVVAKDIQKRIINIPSSSFLIK